MPVLRKREEVGGGASRYMNGQTGVIRSAPNPMVTMNQRSAAGMARLAVDYGRSMALMAEEEARDLARVAALRTGPNGVPLLPPDLSDRLGEIGARTYNNGVREHFMNQMGAAIETRLADIGAEYMFDPEGFAQAAEEALEEMGADVPEGYEAAFQAMGTNAVASEGAAIGRRMGAHVIQERRDAIPLSVDTWTDQITQHIIAGEDETATNAYVAAMQWLDEQPSYILSSAERERYRNQISVEVGFRRLLRDAIGENGGEELSAAQLVDLGDRLRQASDEEILSYFEYYDPSGMINGSQLPAYELARLAANRFNELLGAANMRETAEAEFERQAALADQLLAGATENTADNRTFASAVLGRRLGLQTESGGTRALDYTDWMAMDPQTRANAITEIKNIGYIDESLTEFFNVALRSQDVESMTAAFYIYRDLQRTPNGEGITRDLTGQMPDELREIMVTIDALHGDGNVGREAVTDAIAIYNTMRNEPWDDQQWTRSLRTAVGDYFAGSFGISRTGREVLSRLDSGDIEGAIRAAVLPEVFAGIDAADSERAEAIRAFRIYYRLTGNFEDAIEATRQSFEGRYVETVGMGVERSQFAPETAYRDPPTETVGAFVQGLWDGMRSNAYGAAETLLELPFQFLPEDWEPTAELGADRLGASSFDLLADVAIRELIAAQPDMVRQSALGRVAEDRDMLVRGRDYFLQVQEQGQFPTYSVTMIGENGMPVPIGILDVRDEYQELTRFALEFTALDQLRTTREGSFLAETLGYDYYRLWQEEVARARDSDIPFNPRVFVEELYDSYQADPEGFMADLRG